jgi:hypothetical protein
MIVALDTLTSAILLADLINYIVTVFVFLPLCFSFQASQNYTKVIHDQVLAYRDQILSLTDEKRELIARLETSQEQIRESNETNQAVSAQYRESLALRQTEQTEHDGVVRRHRNLELDHAETLRTLELRNSQLDEGRTQHDTEITAVTEERDRLREALNRTTRKLQRAQASLRNLRDNFPNNAEALLSAPHQIHGLVLTKDGRPDRRYRDGKPFCHFSNEKSWVLHDGRRTYLMLTAVSE